MSDKKPESQRVIDIRNEIATTQHRLKELKRALDKELQRQRNARKYDDVPIEELNLSIRPFNALKRYDLNFVSDVLEELDRGVDFVLAMKNFGEKSLDELIEKLVEKGYLEYEDEAG